MSREDLMREAVRLVRRIELHLPGEAAPVVVGFRPDGSASVFFGEDPVVQFNSRHELRRGYQSGRLIKAENRRLVALTRERLPHQTRLLRHDFTEREATDYLAEIAERLLRLRTTLQAGTYRIVRHIPEGENVLADVRAWLDALPERFAIATSPHAR